MSRPKISDCAQEILLNIFENLQPADLCSVSLVCMNWHRVAEDKYLWRRFLPEEKEGTKSMYIQIVREEMKRYKATPDLTWLKDGSYVGTFSVNMPSDDFGKDVRKVIMTGDFGVGKTSFIRVATNKPFSPSYKATIGVDFALVVRPEGRVQLWDIAGPERFGNMTRVYYKCSHMAVLSFDMSRPESIEKMLHFYEDCILKLETSDWPVKYIVLGFKWDLVPDWGEQQWENVKKRCYAVGGEGKENEIVAFLPVSSKDYLNIKEALDIMYKTMYPPGSSLYIPPLYKKRLHLPDKKTWTRMARGIHGGPVAASSSSWCCIS